MTQKKPRRTYDCSSRHPAFEALKERAGLTEVVARHVTATFACLCGPELQHQLGEIVYMYNERENERIEHTLRFLRGANLVLHLECLAGVNNVNDSAGPRCFKVL